MIGDFHIRSMLLDGRLNYEHGIALGAIGGSNSLKSVMGTTATPVALWKGNETTGATDLAGSDDLTSTGTPGHLHQSKFFDQPVTAFTDSGSDSLTGQVATCNPAGNSWAFLLVYEDYVYSASGRSFVGNKIDAGTGWRMQSLTGGLLRLIRHGVTASRSVDGTQDVQGVGAFLIRNIPGTELGFRDHTGNTYTGTTDNDVCTSSNPFEIGDLGGLVCQGFDFVMAAYWESTIPSYGEFDSLVAFLHL